MRLSMRLGSSTTETRYMPSGEMAVIRTCSLSIAFWIAKCSYGTLLCFLAIQYPTAANTRSVTAPASHAALRPTLWLRCAPATEMAGVVGTDAVEITVARAGAADVIVSVKGGAGIPPESDSASRAKAKSDAD